MENIGIVRQIKIDEEMRGAYLDYAMSVIVSRALPDARDGLKPVHRRILYAMWDMGMRANSPYRKSARIVGEVLGKLHPHGDTSVYDAMVRMAQDFSMRYMLVDGQGNFGSLDGDPPAAMRYTEARMAKIAEELLFDIDSDTVDFAPNFDDSLQEPTVLPAKLPNLLLNGSSGIAVGMATNIPPHNLRELADAINFMIDRMASYQGEGDLNNALDDISVDDLMQFVRGPDFPTGASIGGSELREAYATGKGRIIMRATCNVEETANDRFVIIVTEIPYQVNKANLLERIAELAREGRLDQVRDLRDESDRNGLRIVIELSKSAQPNMVLNRLYKYTTLQTTFAMHLLALVDGEPRLLSLKRALHIYIEHRQTVIRRRSEYELGKARARAHILEGLLKALASIDDIIETIRRADSAEDARNTLMERFSLSQPQAQAILDLQLRRLAALERQRIEDEYKQVHDYIIYLEGLLADPVQILGLIRQDLSELVDIYGDDRRSRIDPSLDPNFDEADLVFEENVLVSMTRNGYIKSTPANIYRSQRRGGRGVVGMATREEDVVENIFYANTLDHILFFSNLGKVYSLPTYQLPKSDRLARGTPIASLLPISPINERITATIPVPDFGAEGYFVLTTKYGRTKRVRFSDFAAVRPSGLIAMGLDDKDELRWVRHTQGQDDILVVSQQGRSIRFSEQDVRVMSRTAMGVNAIRLSDDDQLAGVDIIQQGKHEADLLIITEWGYGKRTATEEFRQQSRFGLGVRAISSDMSKVGRIVGARLVYGEEDVTAITMNGITLRTSTDSISRYNRTAQGVKVMNIDDNDFIVSIALVASKSEAEETLDPNLAAPIDPDPNGNYPPDDLIEGDES